MNKIDFCNTILGHKGGKKRVLYVFKITLARAFCSFLHLVIKPSKMCMRINSGDL